MATSTTPTSAWARRPSAEARTALASLLLLAQAEAVGRLEADDIEVRTRARQELAAMGGKALPALRASGTPEARAAVETILEAAQRTFVAEQPTRRRTCGHIACRPEGESFRRVRELEKDFPGCRVFAGFSICAHRPRGAESSSFLYGVVEADAEVFLIRRGSSIGDTLSRRLAGGSPPDRLFFDREGRLVRVERK